MILFSKSKNQNINQNTSFTFSINVKRKVAYFVLKSDLSVRCNTVQIKFTEKVQFVFFLFQAPLLVVLSCIVASLAMPYPMPYPFPDEPGYGQPAYSPPSYGSVGRVKIQVSLQSWQF